MNISQGILAFLFGALVMAYAAWRVFAGAMKRLICYDCAKQLSNNSHDRHLCRICSEENIETEGPREPERATNLGPPLARIEPHRHLERPSPLSLLDALQAGDGLIEADRAKLLADIRSTLEKHPPANVDHLVDLLVDVERFLEDVAAWTQRDALAQVQWAKLDLRAKEVAP